MARKSAFVIGFSVLGALTLSDCRSRPPSRMADSSTAFSQQDLTNVSKLFQQKCGDCHSSDESQGEFGGVENLEILRTKTTLIKAGNADDSLLYRRVRENEMPPSGPLADAEKQLIKRWIDAGAPATLGGGKKRDHISISRVYELILKDMTTVDRSKASDLRYISLATYYNAVTPANLPAFSDELLTVYTNAIAKIANSLSWRPALVKPAVVPGSNGALLRLDLSALYISRSGDSSRGALGLTPQHWDNLANPHVNMFHIPLKGAVADAVRSALKTDYPVIDAGVFARFVTEAPHYNNIMGIPQPGQKGELEIERNLIGINVASNITNFKTSRIIRAGFTSSGVSQSNRMIERHETSLSPRGYYWKSYDFAKSKGRGQLLSHVVGPASLSSFFFSETFQHDGGEVIWSLPNGMQAYGLYASDGTILGRGPREIVSDPVRGDVVNAVGCMFCHASGIIHKFDEIRDRVLAAPGEFKSGDVEFVKAAHVPNSELKSYFEQDSAAHLTALKKIFEPSAITAEPVNILTEQYRTNEIDVGYAAAHFYLSPQAFLAALEQSPARSEASAFLANGKLRRDQFDEFAGKFIAGSTLADPDAAQPVVIPSSASQIAGRTSVSDLKVHLCASKIEGPSGYQRLICATSPISGDEAARLAIAKCAKIINSVSGNGYSCSLIQDSCKAVNASANPCFDAGYK